MKKKICVVLSLLLSCCMLLTACKNKYLSDGSYNSAKTVCEVTQEYLDGKITREYAKTRVETAYDALENYKSGISGTGMEDATLGSVLAIVLGIDVELTDINPDMNILNSKLDQLKNKIG